MLHQVSQPSMVVLYAVPLAWCCILSTPVPQVKHGRQPHGTGSFKIPNPCTMNVNEYLSI
jgi:hypothetical protein